MFSCFAILVLDSKLGPQHPSPGKKFYAESDVQLKIEAILAARAEHVWFTHLAFFVEKDTFEAVEHKTKALNISCWKIPYSASARIRSHRAGRGYPGDLTCSWVYLCFSFVFDPDDLSFLRGSVI